MIEFKEVLEEFGSLEKKELNMNEVTGLIGDGGSIGGGLGGGGLGGGGLGGGNDRRNMIAFEDQ